MLLLLFQEQAAQSARGVAANSMPFNDLVPIVLAAWLAGLAAVLGALLASVWGTARTLAQRELEHTVTAFGGGVLLSAIAFALAPKAMAVLSPWALALSFLGGGVLFAVLDGWLARQGGSRAQLMAMLMDFVPEALSMGAVFGYDPRLGLLLAAFIAVQNLPEGFNAYRESVAAGSSSRHTLLTLLALSALGPLAAWAGVVWLQDQPTLTGGIMGVAAGGILYLIFQDIAPQARMRHHGGPPLGAVLGFVIGMLGAQALG